MLDVFQKLEEAGRQNKVAPIRFEVKNSISTRYLPQSSNNQMAARNTRVTCSQQLQALCLFALPHLLSSAQPVFHHRKLEEGAKEDAE